MREVARLARESGKAGSVGKAMKRKREVMRFYGV